jgi:membrane-bound inhibitor of C-type lysozyme
MVRFASTALGVTVLAFVTSAFAQDQTPAYEGVVATYVCADGAEIDIAYLKMASGLSLAVVRADGAMHVMETVISGSGARYATAGDGERFVWWSKGNEGNLYSGDDGAEEIRHQDCVGKD